MTKNFTLKYYETFDHHPSEYHELEIQTEKELKEALSNLYHSNDIENVSVSANFAFNDFYVEMWGKGLT